MLECHILATVILVLDAVRHADCVLRISQLLSDLTTRDHKEVTLKDLFLDMDWHSMLQLLIVVHTEVK
jgi:hypothetical protein